MTQSAASLDAKKKLTHARTNLILENPFFGELAMHLRVTEDATAERAWTDGVSLGYNPEYIAGLPLSKVVGVIAHEVMHNACLHPYRQDARELERWNVACDYAINQILVDAHFDLPDDILINPAFANKSAEWIYSQLPPTPPGGGSGAGKGGGKGPKKGGGCGEVRPAPPEAPTESEWQTAVSQAAAAARSAGKLPQSLNHLVEEVMKPKLSWRAIMRRWFQERAKADYSWAIPNRRYISEDIYLPSVRSQSMPPVVFGEDVSGSVSDHEHAACVAEVQSCIDEVRPERTYVIQCDSAIQDVEEIEQGEEMGVSVRHGNGGTSFKPVFEYVEKEGIEPACMVFLTDMYPNDGWPPEPTYPVLWVSVTKGIEGPYGETIYIDDGGLSR